MLAAFKEALGDLDRIAGWIRAVGYVNCTPGFPHTFLVVNGFSDLILESLGRRGQARTRSTRRRRPPARHSRRRRSDRGGLHVSDAARENS